MMYTVKQMAKISGVTIKTLHYYQKIGLLMPAEIGENGYRYYGADEVNTLQTIQFYKKMKLPLETIKILLEENEHKTRIEILEEQVTVLKKQVADIDQVLNTLNQTIKMEQGLIPHNVQEQFDGLDDASIYQTATTMTLIMGKPYLIVIFLTGAWMAFVFGKMAITGEHMLEWITQFPESSQKSVLWLFAILGIIMSAVSFIIFIRTRTKDSLKKVNDMYQ